ncbi:response regulator, partial [Bacillus sp. JJ634]
MKKIKVCVVDDNRELVALLEEYISAQDDMEVMAVAHNGQECLNMLENVHPDILILDIIMPHLDGLGVLEKLREQRGTMPHVIML